MPEALLCKNPWYQDIRTSAKDGFFFPPDILGGNRMAGHRRRTPMPMEDQCFPQIPGAKNRLFERVQEYGM
jgi:hypothetical protein